MVDLWLTAIEDLILSAPGNTDEQAGPLWDSTLDRLGETDEDEARAARFFWDFFEATDVAPSRPFFVLTESAVDWEKYNLRDLAAVGAIEVVYTEPTLQAGDDENAITHKEAKEYFVQWTSALVQWLAENCRSAGVPIAAIRQTVFPQRTPRKNRDPDKPDTDYWWAAWEFVIGETDKRRV
jgi:hypothetical protein